MITRFRPISERSNLGRGRRRKNQWLTVAVTADSLLFCFEVLNRQEHREGGKKKRYTFIQSMLSFLSKPSDSYLVP